MAQTPAKGVFRFFQVKDVLIFLFLALTPLWTSAQAPLDSIPTPDTLPVNEPFLPDSLSTPKRKGIKNFIQKDYPKPSKALILSLAVPGAGQLYNKRWWKVPFVYGAIAGMGYLIERNSTDYILLKRAYRRELRGLPHDFSNTALASSSRLRARRDTADKNRQLAYVGFVAVYGMQAMEAFVDSHLSTFDVSDDLSWRFQPSFQTTPDGLGLVGVGIRLSFE